MPLLRRQRRPSSASCAGVHPRQLHAELAMPKTAEPWSLTSPREKDRRQGRQPRPLRHFPNGRGGRVAADVPREPDADRPAAGAACPGMTGLWGRTHGSRWERCASMNAKQPVPAPRGRNSSLRPPALYRRGRNSLPRSAKSEMMALTDPGIRGMSANVNRQYARFPL
jgi:hypothetical protein